MSWVEEKKVLRYEPRGEKIMKKRLARVLVFEIPW